MWASYLSVLAIGVAAVPTDHNYVIHEKRGDLASGQYSKGQRLERNTQIPVRIALTQSNLDQGHKQLMEISHPSSAEYGKHLTREEVDALFAPSAESTEVVTTWLMQNGICDFQQTSSQGWITFEAPVIQAEGLLRSHFYTYEIKSGTGVRIGVEDYSLPQHVSAHIDYITPGVDLSLVMNQSAGKQAERKLRKRAGRFHSKSAMDHGPSSLADLPRRTDELPLELRSCGLNITPPCIQALYNIPSPSLSVDKGLLGVFEFRNAYSQTNLDQYFAAYAPYVPQGTAPELISINGGVAPVTVTNRSNQGESDIDLDIIFSILGSQPVSLYEVDLPPTYKPNSTVDTLTEYILAAVDGSYCTVQDRVDGVDCGTTNLTDVLSVSYGFSEIERPFKAQDRACNEYMKLSLQGHTILYSSGDYGVAGYPEACLTNGCISRNSSDFAGDIFNPQFPASCPYVLSVGATQLNSNDTVRDLESSMYAPNAGIQQALNCTNASTFFSSSGGFSNMFERPDYQTAAVAAYLVQHDPGYPYYQLSGNAISEMGKIPPGIYNRIGRAMPDVSANGNNFNIFIQDKEEQEAGTSLAVPIWSAILALINQKRRNIGKSRVGFVNPVLYENAHMFHDIVNGTNPGCGTSGFSAVPGWDPTTGLGTPDYLELEKLFMTLP